MKDLIDIVRENDAAHATHVESRRQFDAAVALLGDTAVRLAPPHWGARDNADPQHSVGALAAQWAQHRRLHVSTAHLETTIFAPHRLTDLANRAWHDLTHVMLGVGYSAEDEYAVARAQARCATRYLDETWRGDARVQDGAIALLWFDTAGQTAHHALYGAFPADQRAFILACWDLWHARGMYAREHVGAVSPALTKGPY